FGAITSLLTGLLLHGPASLAVVQGKDLGLPTELVVSLGAGIYEELLFRAAGELLSPFDLGQVRLGEVYRRNGAK
ncbi:MAG TPA: hypothetical protein P5189_02145, partial [Methanomassiliicoccales archaeon]|nr:hypothetical protein [Methanomassiliicoccales archaeon]